MSPDLPSASSAAPSPVESLSPPRALARWRGAIRPLLHNEDWVAAALGVLVLILVIAGARPALPKLRWSTDAELAAAAQEQGAKLRALSQAASIAGETVVVAQVDALQAAATAGNRDAIATAARALGVAAQQVQAAPVKKEATRLSKRFSEAGAGLGNVLAPANLAAGLWLGLAYLLLTGLGVAVLGGNVLRYAFAFPAVFALAWAAQLAAGNATMGYWGLEYVLFALAVGLVISNVLGVPGWLKEAVRTEYFIKTGLVLLGSSVLFSEILQAGALGLAQAVLVVSAVWSFCFWLARRLKVDEELAVMISTAVSICGVSAAIAACGAIKGDKRKLSYVTSLVLIVAVPMMVAMPWVVRTFGIPDIVAGAWLGGTLDTSGSVVAAGSLISDAAMKAGVVVKFSQNVLIGLAAFALTLWWTFRRGGETASAERPNARVIWERFPKFVLGFLAASIAFSFLLSPEVVAATNGTLGALRTTFFALAFVSIGLETRLTDLLSLDRGRPALAFVGAQAFNVAWTLLLAFLLFGGLLFAVPVLS